MKVPLGRSLLGVMLSCISLSAGLSRRYTNHCLFATSISLPKQGVDNLAVGSATGHKNIKSLDSYNKPCEEERQKMAAIIDEAVLGSTTTLRTAAQGAQSACRCSTREEKENCTSTELALVSRSAITGVDFSSGHSVFNNLTIKFHHGDISKSERKICL